MRHLRSIAPISPRTTWPARRARTGYRSALRSSIATTRLICVSSRRSRLLILVRTKYCSQGAAGLCTTGCCSRPVPSRSACLYPGADLPHVATLRSLADCQKIIARAKTSRRATVLGASFIGLEVAAALRTRGLEVHVVAPERVPMERILGSQLGDVVRELHERHGVVFHLENQASSIDSKRLTLRSGGALETDLVVAGIGVRPCIDLAQSAQLTIDRGVRVNSFLETSEPGVFAAGDIARWPDPHSGENMRVEHWVVAERQGQTAARNMLGDAEPFTAVPFFWSQHYDVRINYVGHAEKWDQIDVDGDIAGHDCVLRLKRAGRILAMVSMSRDLASLQAELAMEQQV